jgi:hypothetical protein
MASGFIQSIESGEHQHCPPAAAKAGKSGIHGPTADMTSEILVSSGTGVQCYDFPDIIDTFLCNKSSHLYHM